MLTEQTALDPRHTVALFRMLAKRGSGRPSWWRRHQSRREVAAVRLNAEEGRCTRGPWTHPRGTSSRRYGISLPLVESPSPRGESEREKGLGTLSSLCGFAFRRPCPVSLSAPGIRRRPASPLGAARQCLPLRPIARTSCPRAGSFLGVQGVQTVQGAVTSCKSRRGGCLGSAGPRPHPPSVERSIRSRRRAEASGIPWSPGSPTWDSMEAISTSAVCSAWMHHRLWKRWRTPPPRSCEASSLETRRGAQDLLPSPWAAHVIALAGGENAAQDTVP